jgi:hypothetical protein
LNPSYTKLLALPALVCLLFLSACPSPSGGGGGGTGGGTEDSGNPVPRIDFQGKATKTVTLRGLQKQSLYLVKVNGGATAVAGNKTGYADSVSGARAAAVPDRGKLDPQAGLLSGLFTGADGGAVTRYDYAPAREFARLLGGMDLPLSPVSNITGDPARAVAPQYTVDSSTKQFWIDQGNSWIQINTHLRAASEHANVWVRDENYAAQSVVDNDNKITGRRAQEMADQFDIIYKKMTPLFGYEYGGGLAATDGRYGGVDGDSTIQILVYDIDGDYQPNQTGGTFGYFWSKDYFPQSALSSIKTNRAEMFYVDSHFTDKFPQEIFSTLAHEFQHMINFAVKYINKGKTSSAWYDEMLSMLAEDVIAPFIGISLDDWAHPAQVRMSLFLNHYFYSGITDWLGDGQVLYSYASAYAFGAYLVRNFGGADLVAQILKNNETNEASITAALGSQANPRRSEVATFAQAVSRYGEALVFSGDKTPQGALSFDKTVSKTINGTVYTFSGFDIWAMDNPFSGQFYFEDDEYAFAYPAWGPLVIDTALIADMPRYSVLVQSADAWQNISGDITVTLTKPENASVEFYLMVR